MGLSGGTASSTVINSGGQEGVVAGINISTTVHSGGGLFIHGGTDIHTTLSGLEVVFAGAVASATVIENIGSLGGTNAGIGIFGHATGTIISNDGQAGVQSGGTAVNTTVSSGGILFVLSAATVLGAAVKHGGLEVLFSGSVLGSGTSATTVSSGGTFEAIGFDASHLPIKLLTGATLEVGSGATLRNFTVRKASQWTFSPAGRLPAQ